MNSKSEKLLWVFLAVDIIWIRSSFDKLTGGKFVSTLGITLEKFASNNPYPFVKSFLVGFAIPNYQTFGFLTMWGETFIAYSLLFSLFYLIFKGYNRLAVYLLSLGLLVGMFLNSIFWFSSGWMSPSADSINLLMFLIELIGLVFTINLIKEKR